MMAIPSVVAEVARNQNAPVLLFPGRIKVVDLAADDGGVSLVPSKKERVSKALRRSPEDIVPDALVRRIPSEHAAIPLPAPFASDPSIATDVRGDVAAVLLDARLPGVDIFEQPRLVFRFLSQQVGMKRQIGCAEVERVIAENVGRLEEARARFGARQ